MDRTLPKSIGIPHAPIGLGRDYAIFIDAALQYHTLDYYDDGQFVDPNSTNSNTMLDKIIENNLSFLTTLKWSF